MSKLPLDLSPSRAFSKIDRTNYSRMMWKAAYRQSRAMIRDRRTSTAATAYTWFLQHARRRFTTLTGWRIAQAAGSLVFERRVVGRGASGDVEHLLRQGLVR